MRLAIADPPYLGHAEWYGGPQRNDLNMTTGTINRAYPADNNPDAHLWDDPATHQALVDSLASYDGWAIALLPAHLKTYLPWVPHDTRIAVWHDPQVMPTGSHPRRRWEAVIVRVPPGRRRVTKVPHAVADVLTANHPGARAGRSFAGAKPRAWTRWVLDMMGYDDQADTVADLFPGSGAVTKEAQQLIMRWETP